MKTTKNVPKMTVSAESEIARLRRLLTSGEEVEINSDGTFSETQEPADKEKAKVVPKSTLSAESVSDLINRMRGVNAQEDLEEEEAEEPEEKAVNPKKSVVPKSVLSAGTQWYERDPDLFKKELMAMHDFKPEARYYFTPEGQMYWLVRCTPKVAGIARTYTIALMYDADHPKARYGTSVKGYLISPSLDDLQEIVNETPTVNPKFINHTLSDEKGEKYICSISREEVDRMLQKGQVPSAALSLRCILRFINVFELGLQDPITWSKFQRDGEI